MYSQVKYQVMKSFILYTVMESHCHRNTTTNDINKSDKFDYIFRLCQTDVKINGCVMESNDSTLMPNQEYFAVKQSAHIHQS